MAFNVTSGATTYSSQTKKVVLQHWIGVTVVQTMQCGYWYIYSFMTGHPKPYFHRVAAEEVVYDV